MKKVNKINAMKRAKIGKKRHERDVLLKIKKKSKNLVKP